MQATHMRYFRRIKSDCIKHFAQISMRSFAAHLQTRLGEEWPEKKLKQLEDSAISGKAARTRAASGLWPKRLDLVD